MTASAVRIIGPQQWVDRITALLADVDVPVEGYVPGVDEPSSHSHGPLRRSVACGTPSGYVSHYRRGEKPCQACRDGFNTYRRAWRRQGRAA